MCTFHLQNLQWKTAFFRTRRPERGYSGAGTSKFAMAAVRSDNITEWMESNLDGGKIVGKRPMGSSGWSSASVYETEKGDKYFVKETRGHGVGMFEGEALGLQAMYDTQTLRIPKVYHYGSLGGGGAFLVMEYMDFGGRSSQRQLGEGLARMHQATPVDPQAKEGKFGFAVDNTIGGTEQPNGWMDDWVDFLRERRIGHMLRLCNDSGLNKLGDKLLPNLGKFFEGVEVKPSLLHGDLWSGNMASVAGGGYAILDPATYYGHHEAEFGMSWCASFGHDFWQGYRSVIPEDEGFSDRRQIYLAYHYLNHFHLFGSGYRGQAEGCLRHLVNKL